MKRIINIVGFVVLIFTTIRFIPIEHRLVDLASNFVWQLFAVLAVCVVLLLIARQMKNAILFALFLAINISSLLPLYFDNFPDNKDPQPGEKLTLLQANVQAINIQYADFFQVVNESNADIIVLQEVNNAWARQLKQLDINYPYGAVVTREDNFGIAIFSRFLMDARMHKLGKSEFPSLHGTFEFGGKKMNIVASHPPPPVNDYLYALRNDQLGELAVYLNQLFGERILIGDLNTGPWSKYFEKLTAETGMRDARAGYGVLATWPASLYFMGIPIDHCLISNGLRVKSLRIGKNFGSDHLPLIVQLEMRK